MDGDGVLKILMVMVKLHRYWSITRLNNFVMYWIRFPWKIEDTEQSKRDFNHDYQAAYNHTNPMMFLTRKVLSILKIVICCFFFSGISTRIIVAFSQSLKKPLYMWRKKKKSCAARSITLFFARDCSTIQAREINVFWTGKARESCSAAASSLTCRVFR